VYVFDSYNAKHHKRPLTFITGDKCDIFSNKHINYCDTVNIQVTL